MRPPARLSLLLAAACATPQPGPAATAGATTLASRPHITSIAAGHQLVGCYRLTLGPWSQSSRLGPPSPTEIFRLDSTIAPRALPGWRVAARLAPVDLLPPTDPRAQWLKPAMWRMIGSDSLEIITWSTGMEAESFHGHVARDELRGVLRRTSDAIPMDPKTGRIMWDAWPWAKATARRVACP